MKIKFNLNFIFIDLDNNVDQEAAEQEKKELIESLIVKTKMEEQEVFNHYIFFIILIFPRPILRMVIFI